MREQGEDKRKKLSKAFFTATQFSNQYLATYPAGEHYIPLTTICIQTFNYLYDSADSLTFLISL